MNVAGDNRMRCQLQCRFSPTQHFSLTFLVAGAIASKADLRSVARRCICRVASGYSQVNP